MNSSWPTASAGSARPGSAVATGAARDGNGAAGPPPLALAIVVGLRALGDLAHLPAGVADGRLEALLRASLAQHLSAAGPGSSGNDPDPASAVQAACAYLAAGGREDAYLALRTARDLLPRGSATAGNGIDSVVAGLRG